MNIIPEKQRDFKTEEVAFQKSGKYDKVKCDICDKMVSKGNLVKHELKIHENPTPRKKSAHTPTFKYKINSKYNIINKRLNEINLNLKN